MVPWPGGVEHDFLEVPSMALEKFVCEPSLLSRVAQHYSGNACAPKLEDETIGKAQALEKWMVGIHKSKYFAMALFDLLAHSQAPPYSFEGADSLSTQELFARILEKYTLLPRLSGSHCCASWYHLVIGYDAGYYGYGWSDVYAADVFAAMKSSSAGLLSAETGARLRDEILGPCASRTGRDSWGHSWGEHQHLMLGARGMVFLAQCKGRQRSMLCYGPTKLPSAFHICRLLRVSQSVSRRSA